MSVVHVVALLIAVLVLFLVMPIFWHTRVTLDWARFTEEWYKECFRFAELLFVVFLATFWWDRHTRERDRRQRQAENDEAMATVKCACKKIASAIEDLVVDGTATSGELFESSVSALREAFADLKAIARLAAEMPPGRAQDDLRRFRSQYYEVERIMGDIGLRLKEGQIASAKPLEDAECREFDEIGQFAGSY